MSARQQDRNKPESWRKQPDRSIAWNLPQDRNWALKYKCETLQVSFSGHCWDRAWIQAQLCCTGVAVQWNCTDPLEKVPAGRCPSHSDPEGWQEYCGFMPAPPVPPSAFLPPPTFLGFFSGISSFQNHVCTTWLCSLMRALSVGSLPCPFLFHTVASAVPTSASVSSPPSSKELK